MVTRNSEKKNIRYHKNPETQMGAVFHQNQGFGQPWQRMIILLLLLEYESKGQINET